MEKSQEEKLEKIYQVLDKLEPIERQNPRWRDLYPDLF